MGEERGGHYYPTLAGVANSIDFYPRPHTLPDHGCAQLALGQEMFSFRTTFTCSPCVQSS